MKYLSTLALSIIFSFVMNQLIAQSCLPQGISFSFQSEIDNFTTNYPGCTEILGDVTINDNDLTGNLTNLSGLSGITSIGGDLEIRDNVLLNDLSGLENLQSVGGNFEIGDNLQLTNVDGFNNLTTLGGFLSIYYNLALESVNGFNGLTTIGDYFDLISNEVLLDINGFQNLQSITGQFQIESNFMLDDISGFSSLQNIGGYVVIEDNTVLASLLGLSQLQTIGQSLRISNNPALTNIDPFDNLISISTQCRIFANNSLSDCAIQILCDGGTQIGGIIDIFSNANGCQDINEVVMSCFQGTNIEVEENSIVLPSQPTSTDTYTLSGTLSSYTIDILDSTGAIVQTLNPSGTEEIIDLTSLPMGLHFLRMLHNTNNNLFLQVNIKE